VEWAPKLAAALQGDPRLTDVNSDQQNKGLEANVVIDRDAAARLGITVGQIDNTLYDAFGQRQVSTIYVARNQYHVVVEAAPQYWQNPETLSQVYVSTSGGSVGGSSMGGGLAIDFALEHPNRTVALVLMGTAVTGAEGYEVDEEVEQLEEAFEYARERGNISTANRIQAHEWLDGPYGEAGRVTGPVRELFLAMNEIHLNHPQLTPEERPQAAFHKLAAITAPTLLVVGELDCSDIIAINEDLSEELENAFAVVLEDTAHFPSLERPDLFDPILFEFLEAVTGQGDDDEDAGDD